MKAEIEMVHIRDGVASRKRDVVVTEIPLTVFLNDVEVATLLTSDFEHKLLAVGFLFAEGFLRSKDELSDISESTEPKVVRVYTSEKQDSRRTSPPCDGLSLRSLRLCGAFKVEPMGDTLRVSSEVIFGLMHRFQTQSVLFRETGGVHSCALAQEDRIVLMKEDIGRHNAMDRVLGTCFLENIPLEDKMILTSGRVSSEIVFKAGRGRVPVLVSRGAPTDLAIRIADQAGITLVGFVRGRRMNVYAHSERIDVVL